jgi:hypothetical protein
VIVHIGSLGPLGPAAMEYAYRQSDMEALLRVETLVRRLNDAES